MSVIKDGVVCYDPDCWVRCCQAFKGMCQLHVHAFQVLGNLSMYLSSLQHVDYHGFCFKKIFPY